MKKLLFLGLLFSLIWGCNHKTGKVYLFSYVIQGQDKNGLQLAYSRDGYNWAAIKKEKSFLIPLVGTTKNDKQYLLRGDSSKIMRDPCIIMTKDGTFHMVWTVAWSERGIGYASSKDLINWSEQKFIPVMEKEPTALNCWAPEIFFDEKNNQYLIFWATTIPGRFPVMEEIDSRFNNRIYYVTTKDFESFSETKLFYDQGFDVIDATIIKDGGKYIMLVKEYTKASPHDKHISITKSESLYGPYPPSTSIEGKSYVEGPTVIKISKTWIVYFDRYSEGKMGAIKSKDLENWEDISDIIRFPEGVSHGTVFEISEKVLNKLIN